MAVPVVRPRGDPWIDLVHHTLAHLPIDPQDASSLYNPTYIEWAAAALPRPADARRTLPEDAARLAALYDASPGTHRLQGCTDLHATVDDFLECARFGVADTDWPGEQAAVGVRALAAEVGTELVELFRIALWGETQAGYLELHDTLNQPVRAAAEALSDSLARLQPRLSGLNRVDWTLCHSLGYSGRLSWLPGTRRRRILVGVADPALGIPPWAPLLQGVHEFLLSEVHLALAPPRLDPAAPRDTRAGRTGYRDFFTPELLTLCLDCRVLDAGFTARPLRRWLARYYPHGETDLAPQLEAAGLTPGRPCGLGPEGFMSWLATGEVLPSTLWPRYRELLEHIS